MIKKRGNLFLCLNKLFFTIQYNNLSNPLSFTKQQQPPPLPPQHPSPQHPQHSQQFQQQLQAIAGLGGTGGSLLQRSMTTPKVKTNTAASSSATQGGAQANVASGLGATTQARHSIALPHSHQVSE